MLDNIKLSTKDQIIINRLAEMQGISFEPYQHRNNNFEGFRRCKNLMRLDFRKSFENGILVGYHHLEISISPHYHFNNYLHNGNDFTPENCIKTIPDILTYLGIEPQEYDLLKVVNIEFGLNIIPETDIKNLIDGLYFYKKTPFKVGDFPYFKKTDATTYKQIKAYAKGLQFAEFPQYGIDKNTFRFEVKTKQSKNILKYGINTVLDLLKLETYQRLSQEIINEWEYILLINQTPDFSNLKPSEVQFIQKANNKEFWSEMYRVKFARSKEKYHKISGTKNNLQHLIKSQIIDKLFSFQNVTFSTQKNPINSEKQCFEKTQFTLINLENVTPHQNNRECLVTNLDISMQKKGSKFLCIAGLKYYKENNPEIYKDLEKKYLSEKRKVRTMEEQLYYLAHNIRNFYNNNFYKIRKQIPENMVNLFCTKTM